MKNPLLGLIVFLVIGVTAIVSIGVYKKNKEDNKLETSPAAINNVPLLGQGDVIRTFFNLVNEKKINEAIDMMTEANTSNDLVKQAWGVMLNAFKKIDVTSIEAAGENIYKVGLNVEMEEEASDAKPIPYYGFGNGSFTRWIGLEKENNLWRISGIATAP